MLPMLKLNIFRVQPSIKHRRLSKILPETGTCPGIRRKEQRELQANKEPKFSEEAVQEITIITYAQQFWRKEKSELEPIYFISKTNECQ